MPRIPDEILRSVVYVYKSVEATNRGEAVGGSGFLLDYTSERNDQTFRYVVLTLRCRAGGTRSA